MTDAVPGIGSTVPCCTKFTGQMDDIAIYAQNLDGVTIREIYEEQKGRYFSVAFP
jgi:hypothetical protein